MIVMLVFGLYREHPSCFLGFITDDDNNDFYLLGVVMIK